MITVLEYEDEAGESPFQEWFLGLNGHAARKIRTRIARLEAGNASNIEGIGEGAFECKIDFGPGYRIYFGKDGNELVILLGGGTKKRQQQDINQALEYWRNYKLRKVKEA